MFKQILESDKACEQALRLEPARRLSLISVKSCSPLGVSYKTWDLVNLCLINFENNE